MERGWFNQDFYQLLCLAPPSVSGCFHSRCKGILGGGNEDFCEKCGIWGGLEGKRTGWNVSISCRECLIFGWGVLRGWRNGLRSLPCCSGSGAGWAGWGAHGSRKFLFAPCHPLRFHPALCEGCDPECRQLLLQWGCKPPAFIILLHNLETTAFIILVDNLETRNQI